MKVKTDEGAKCVEIQSVKPLSAAMVAVNLIVDYSAPQNRICAEIAAELARLGFPYRDVDPRIFEGVDLVRNEGLSVKEASIQVFGNSDYAEKIRSWRNKLGNLCKLGDRR